MHFFKHFVAAFFLIISFGLFAEKSYAVLTISLDKATIDFETMSPGDFKEIPTTGYYNNLAVVSDTSSVWQVKIKVSSALINASNPSQTISNDQFRWMSTYAGNKNSPYQNLSNGLNHKPAQGYVNFSLVDELVYTSGLVSDFNDNNNSPNGTEIQFKYALAMPDNQAAGTYNTTITYTVTQ